MAIVSIGVVLPPFQFKRILCLVFLGKSTPFLMMWKVFTTLLNFTLTANCAIGKASTSFPFSGKVLID